MIHILIAIIIIMVFIELYLRYYDLIFNNSIIDTDNDIDNIKDKKNDINIWDKVVPCKKYTKYYIKINNNNVMPVFIEWKTILNNNIIMIDYDVDNNYLIVKTRSEEEALSIVNLFISNLNNELELDEIIDNNLINISKRKAKAHKLVKIKLIELIKNGLKKMEDEDDDIMNKYDTNNIIEDDIDYFSNNIRHVNKIESNYNSYDENKIKDKTDDVRENVDSINSIITSDMSSIQNEVIQDVIYNNNPFDKIMKKPLISGYGGSEYSNINF